MTLTTILVLLIVLYLLITNMTKKQQNSQTQQSYTPKDCQNGNIDLILESIDNNKQIIALRELRFILDLDLKTCKYIIDNAPIVVLKNISEDQVQYLQEKFYNIGIKISFDRHDINQ